MARKDRYYVGIVPLREVFEIIVGGALTGFAAEKFVVMGLSIQTFPSMRGRVLHFVSSQQ
jgi:hypothetical protein